MRAKLLWFSLIVATPLLAQDKVYLRGNFHGQSGFKELTFGLSPAQRSKILALTQGKVDLTNHFVTKASNSRNLPGERHKAFYPPPFFLGEYDPDTLKGWWQQAHKVQETWALATGRGVTVADCDAGYYIREKDLAPNLLVDHARDFSDKDAPLRVDDGPYITHGTSVSAILVGGLDGVGVNGMAPGSKLVPLQNFNYSSSDDLDKEEATAACILGALKIPDVKVIVLENQTHGSSETFAGTRQAVRLALAAGVTIVSAAGNSSNELKEEAADDTGSIIVGAIRRDGSMESFSNRGSRVCVAAYGSDLLTLEGPNGKLGSFGGTSGATPQVAAAVALMLEVRPELTPAQIKDILVETRDTKPSNQAVGGALNFAQAVAKAKRVVPQITVSRAQKNFRSKLATVLRQR